MARFPLALLVVAMLATSSRAALHDNTELGEAEEALTDSDVDLVGQDEQSVQVEADQIVERVLRSSAREGRNLDRPGTTNGKKRPQKKPQKSKKGKRGKQSQRRKGDGEDSPLKKKGKGKKGTGRKGKTGKGKKGKKGKWGKPKRKDGALTSRQTGRRNIVQGRTCRDGHAINETCVSNILAMYAIYANQMKNFEKQYKRIQAKNKTSNNKGGKKGAFNKALERLVEQGGGNKSSLSCQGSTTNDGAKQLKNLTDFLGNCSNFINDACNVTVPGNLTEMEQCAADAKAFGEEFDKCKKMGGEAACDCFANDTLQDFGNKTKKCNLADEAKAMVAADKKCKKAYGECRKYQEDIIGAVSSCSKSTDQLKQKAKSLTENSKNLDEAKKAVSALTSARYRQSAHQRGRRAAPTDCAGMITIATLVITIVSENPASPQVSVYCLEIVAATGITCSDEEKESLKGVETSMDEAAEKLEEATEAVFEDLENQTGTTPSTSELESFEPAAESVSTSAPKSRRRFEDFLKGVLK